MGFMMFMLFHWSIYDHVNTVAGLTKIHLCNLLAEINFASDIVVLTRPCRSLEPNEVQLSLDYKAMNMM